MRIMINASNLRIGGGLQVADSVCRELNKFTQHEFIVVYPKALEECAKAIAYYENVEIVGFETPIDWRILLTGRCKFLDNLVNERNIDVVLTIFGPSRWRPRIPHLSGFAKPQLVLPESPFWKQLPLKQWLIYQVKNKITKFLFDKCADYYFTENPFITERLQSVFPTKKIFTVTNNFNQIFLHPEQWDSSIKIPPFDGLTMLTISANYPHKNLPIIIKTCNYLEEKYPSFRFRFVLTIKVDDLKGVNECANKHIVFLGPVKLPQVPPLYKQTDIMLLPTLLECFSASYAEAMVMKKPILTTDLNFAHGLCGDSAQYFDATSYKALGDAIVHLSNDRTLCQKLVANGEQQMKKFDSFEQRAEKLIRLTETISNKLL